ncbi:MAG: M23 family metallopeptidase [Saprospiraceae bacterium]|nr:M23 family metallopeptidase [Saprospiraceae bacterium]
MLKAIFPLLCGASIAIFAIWGFEPKQHAAGIGLPEERKTETHPTDFFGPPISGPVMLTGTCGELRPNHFHAGLDIDGVTGNAILASADGFIETIKVQAGGYGNVLYLKHPNGYTTLYAHLDRFSADIQKYVKAQQYEHERFEVDLNPPLGMFQVKKGQLIGYLGNTGGSQGPHLHFEIRSPSGKAVNPLLCGIPVTDNLAPEIRDMKVYFLNAKREVLGSKPLSLNKDKYGNIGLEGDTVRIGGNTIGFGVKSYDRSNLRRNDNGVYSVALFTNDKLAFQWTADEFDFDDTRYLNAHIDYPARQKMGAWFHRCFALPGNFLTNYTRTETMGAIQLHPEKPVKVTIKVADAAGNMKSLHFWVLQDEAAMESFMSAPFLFLFPYDQENHLDMDGLALTLPVGSLYESVQMQYLVSVDSSSDLYSPMHHLHDERTPLHKNFDIRIKPTHLPPTLRSKAVIANCNSGRPDNCGGVWQGDWLSTKTKAFGDYCVMVDTIAPRISPVAFTRDMRRKSSMSFRILDNFAVAGLADNLSYRGTIDGKWVLFEFDKKRNRIIYTFDEKVGKGEHTVHISVKDDRGNEGVFQGKFIK